MLIHRKWISNILQKTCVNDRVMAVDLKVSKKIIRIMAVYLYHSGYGWNYFQETMADIERLAMEALDKRYSLIIAADFNLSLDQGDRGRAMNELCTQFSMDIANGQTLEYDADKWTWKFRSYLRGIYYILHAKSLRSFDITTNYDLDLDSDHRNVSTSLEMI